MMPILMSKEEWARINKWTDSNKEDPDVVRKREYVKFLDDTSRKMTKSWPNSVENVNKRNEELRQARIAAAESANTRFYQKYVKKKKEEQRRLMYSARDTVFKNKDAPKLLLSAVIETVVQKERALQLKFNAERKREQDEMKRKEDEEITRKAKEWHEQQGLKEKLRFETNKQHQRDILEQAFEVSEKSRKEHEEELDFQKKDNITANEQMAAIKLFEEELRETEKARIFRDMDRAQREVAARRGEQRARDELDDELLAVLVRARGRIDARRKHTEKQIKDEKLRVLEAISSKLESGDAARDEKEQKILEKAVKEKLDAEQNRRQLEVAKKNRIKMERIEMHEKFLRDEDQRVHELNTMKQWECMNRFKNVELNEEFQQKLRKEKAKKISDYREDILKLWKEREDREARESAERRYFYGELAERKMRDADNKLLTHGQMLIDEAKANGRPDLSLQKAIDHYCKLNRLYPMPPLPAPLQEHLPHYQPRDLSIPDPHYTYPTPPDNDRKDGLQPAIPKMAPSKPKLEKREENVKDYKRTGRADGMQRRGSVAVLPDISVIPCKSQDCACDLKPKVSTENH